MDDCESEFVEFVDLTNPGRLAPPKPSPEIEFLKRRLDEEMHGKWAAQNQLIDPNTVRLSGRVARIDRKTEESAYGTLWLALPDLNEEFQAVKVQGAFTDLLGVSETDRVTLLANWKRGRLNWTDVESIEKTDEPMPKIELPDPKGKDPSKQDGKLPTMSELDKQSREGGWGALNHSVYRFNVPVHVTFSPKCRAKLFEGRAAEVQAICREVAESEGLNVIALAAESDHLHVLGIPEGAGGQPPTWVWSTWIGRFKALTSKRLKSLPGLEEFSWQVGYALTSVAGGKQGAEQALELVKRYVEKQGVQDDLQGPSDESAG